MYSNRGKPLHLLVPSNSLTRSPKTSFCLDSDLSPSLSQVIQYLGLIVLDLLGDEHCTESV